MLKGALPCGFGYRTLFFAASKCHNTQHT